MKMKINFLGVIKPAFFLGVLLFCLESTAGAEMSAADKDPIFGGQILSLTDKKEGLKPSNDPRYQDNHDGTVTDRKEGFMWKKQDSYQ